MLIHASVKSGHLERAFDLFQKMRIHGIEPDAMAFSAMIHGYAKDGQVERAVGIFEDMKRSGRAPTHVTYNTMIHACANSTYYAERARDYFHWMKADGYFPDKTTYNSLLHACSRNGDVAAASEVTQDMAEHQVPWDEYTYNTLINVYARAQIKRIYDNAPTRVEKRKAKELVERRKLRMENPPPPAEIPFDEEGRPLSTHQIKQEQMLLQGQNEDGEIESLTSTEIDEFLREATIEERMEEVDNALSTVTDELAIVDAAPFPLMQGQHIDKAVELFEQMRKNGAAISTVTLNSVLNVYANALRIRGAESFYTKEFLENGITPTLFTYRSLIRMYTRSKRFDDAVRVLQDMRAADIMPDGYIYGLLVDAYAGKAKLKEALQLLEQVQRNGIKLEERFLSRVRRLADSRDVVTHLIPEDPDAHMFMSRRKFLERAKRRRHQLNAS